MEFQEIKVLEEKIEGLLALLERMRQQNEDLKHQLQQKEEELAKIQQELNLLRSERQEVKDRVQTILSKLDQLPMG